MSGCPLLVPLFAQATRRDFELAIRSPQFILATGLLILVILAGALALYLVDRWRKRQLSDAETMRESAESLTSFRAMFERGELTREEYERVREKMAAKIKREVVAGQPSIGSAGRTLPAGDAEGKGPGEGANFAPDDSSASTRPPTSPET